MSEKTLNAWMAVGLEKRSVNDFPFVELLINILFLIIVIIVCNWYNNNVMSFKTFSHLLLQLILAQDAFLAPDSWLYLAPNVMEDAHPCSTTAMSWLCNARIVPLP